MSKVKIDRKQLRRERANKQKTIVEIVDEEHKDLEEVQEPEPVEKSEPVQKKKRQYKKKVNKE